MTTMTSPRNMSTDTRRAGWAANRESLVLTGRAVGVVETVVIVWV
jgi:hypothetical protein